MVVMGVHDGDGDGYNSDGDDSDGDDNDGGELGEGVPGNLPRAIMHVDHTVDHRNCKYCLTIIETKNFAFQKCEYICKICA